ncbi:MAG: hypothetical protein KME09_05955 [Pleurocapsa minor HA4230-MV1]|jgi:hypothetical protein|nr:hypothetical protein [Pleurocapsa minor HA4230-MV1]
MPNYDQLLKTVQICHALSDMRQDILLFLYDENTSEFFILAGKRARIEVTIYPDSTVGVEIEDAI